MKKSLLLLIIFLFSNCSFNSDSQFWTEQNLEKKKNKDKLLKIMKKSSDIMSMSIEEYEIYMDDYIKKSKYPNINQ